jgi:UDP:flavonoid glycosyltransferase YjiC (YdhE family)
MRCIVTSFGSAGDFLPTLALAAALRRRDHEVRFVANPFYREWAARAGFELIPAGDHYDLNQRLEDNPAYGNPANGKALFEDLVAPNTMAIHAVIRELLRARGADLVIANDASFGAFWAAAGAGVRRVAVHATPMVWAGRRAPLVFGELPLPRRLAAALTGAARPIVGWYVSRLLRPLARQLGVAPADASFAGTERLAALRLGLWSPLLRGPLPGDPPNGVICGYTRASALGAADDGLAPEVSAFLSADAAPVVVGLGSAFSLISGPLIAAVAQACADLGRRCLVIGHPAAIALPPNTLAVRYAPYDRVFPRAAAVVVHGGAGTTGEALRCGRPIVGVPFAYDQFGLCAAVEELRAGVRVPRARRGLAELACILAAVLADGALHRRAAETGRRFAAEPDGAEVGADAVEQLPAS